MSDPVEQAIIRGIELNNKSLEALYSWLRYLVGLAAGGLTVLVSLSSPPTGFWSCLFQDMAVLSLGIGILAGAIRLYAERWHARKVVLLHSDQLEAHRLTGAEFSSIHVDIPKWWRNAEQACYLFLFAALISLVAFGVLKIHSPQSSQSSQSSQLSK
jgi:hypothetical protein